MSTNPQLALSPAFNGIDSSLELEEATLIRAALAGDGRAFETLVRPHLAVLYRVTARACSDPNLAEDAAQETLTLAYKKLKKYTPGTSFRAFLLAIGVRRASTLLRGEKRRRVRELGSETPQGVSTPEQELQAKALAHNLRAALEAMPKKRREAAWLRLDGGLSYEEIAQAVGSSPSSARVLVHLALQDLKSRLNLGENHG